MLSDQVLTQITLVLGSIISTWLTLKYKDRVFERKAKNTPDTRISFALDAYEKVIRELERDVQRSRKINEDQADQIEKMNDTITKLRTDIREIYLVNKDLVNQLARVSEPA